MILRGNGSTTIQGAEYYHPLELALAVARVKSDTVNERISAILNKKPYTESWTITEAIQGGVPQEMIDEYTALIKEEWDAQDACFAMYEGEDE